MWVSIIIDFKVHFTVMTYLHTAYTFALEKIGIYVTDDSSCTFFLLPGIFFTPTHITVMLAFSNYVDIYIGA